MYSVPFAAVKARGSHIRVHYKHCREISHAIKGMGLNKAKVYLGNVLTHKAAIPFTKYTGGIGRHAVGKQYKAPGDKCAFPEKATRVFLDLLRNLESNAEVNISRLASHIPLYLINIMYIRPRA